MSATIWKSEEARARLEEWHERFADRITVPLEKHFVETSFGRNLVLTGGPESSLPLVCLHAMRTGSAHLLSELGPLLERFRIIAPDLPNQSVYGPQIKVPLNDDSLAQWLLEVLDGFGIEKVYLFGVSWGGFIARQIATVAPERVEKLVLLVPAGIVNGSHWVGLTRMAIPMLKYRFWPTEKNLRAFLDPLLTTWDEHWAQFMGESLNDMAFNFEIPPLASDAELRQIQSPTLVLGADNDISFPGEKLVKRAQLLIPNCDVEVIADCKHCPPTTEEFRLWLADRVIRFLNQDGLS
ncbi:alpha/beta hydrolase [uncultured Gimesia sp.]|uniref:alpha/beta fold hydrolase n=1 Tax=uncultured Gimesia sp. TaxID=1678688 RepID=UPI0026377169|nr:alpha/beta hydrolase [uncultured Gimesia sp.]